MSDNLSKTAKASLGIKGNSGGARACPQCGSDMVPTRVIRSADQAGGMYWV